MNITKASGDIVPFSEDKLKNSLRKAGADNETINYVLEEVEKEIYEGITTRKIYKKAFSLLKKNRLRPVGARYKIKQAIMELGPSGFPFERYIGEIFKYKGYKVKVGETVQGHCVKHEVDVILENNQKIIFIECKYHKSSGFSCDVKIPLYINSRFMDIEKQSRKQKDYDKKIHEGWIATNTRFTSDAIKYSLCVGLHLIGWDYPAKGSLRDIINESGLYPLTALTTLSLSDKQKLLEKKIVLCQEIKDNENFLVDIGLSVIKIKDVMDECIKLCCEVK